MNIQKIYMTTQIPKWVQAKLSAHLPDFEILRLSEENLIQHKSENVVGLMVRSQTHVSLKLINHFKDLKIVGTATSGFDHLDLKTLKERQIISFFTPDANVASTADLTLIHILMCLRNNFTFQTLEKNFNWKHQLPLGYESNGKNLGIVGFGRIGTEVANRALSLGFKVYFNDPYIDPQKVNSQFKFLELNNLLKTCDIISLHTPLTNETKNLINKESLNYLGENKSLVNCARGELIDLDALLQALDSGILKSVGLDTFDTEPLPSNSALRHHPKIFWTPHIGAYTHEAFEKSCMEASDVFIKFFADGNLPKNTLPPNVAWAKQL